MYCIKSIVRYLAFLSIIPVLMYLFAFPKVTYVALARPDDTVILSQTSLLSGTSGKIDDNDNNTGKGKVVSL